MCTAQGRSRWLSICCYRWWFAETAVLPLMIVGQLGHADSGMFCVLALLCMLGTGHSSAGRPATEVQLAERQACSILAAWESGFTSSSNMLSPCQQHQQQPGYLLQHKMLLMSLSPSPQQHRH